MKRTLEVRTCVVCVYVCACCYYCYCCHCYCSCYHCYYHNHNDNHHFLNFDLLLLDVDAERRKSLQGLTDLRTETIPLVESEEESVIDRDQSSHKFISFKMPSGMLKVERF